MDDFKPMSAQALLDRKRCCKSACLHCPYGHTIKTLGLELREYQQENLVLINDALVDNGINTKSDFTANLLAQNLGEKIKTFDLSNENLKTCRLIYLKDHYVGFIHKEDELYLLDSFKFQKITLDLVKEYL